MQKRGGFKVKRPPSAEMALQITSMADIFTILLVFLLKSFATSSVNVTPTQGMRLPAAANVSEPAEALTVEISEKAVQVDNALIAPLTSFRFAPADVQANGLPTSLDTALDRQRKRQELISKANSDVQADKKILIIADERTPYVTLKSVLSAAAVHGFSDFKLVVAKKE